ncbi:MAG: acyltransferase [Gemmatimonadetes bacterium]|nr:acyltransferase [Gemmatimonadota bacterium]
MSGGTGRTAAGAAGHATASPADAGVATSRLHIVDALRGPAALAVACYHVTNGNVRLLQGNALAAAGSYGWLGVDVFFVISGFVIPYALASGGYHWRDAGRFLLKRIIRLDPPYLVTLAVALLLAWVSAQLPTYRGKGFAADPLTIALHLGYLTEIFGRTWFVLVFWTLALEFQFYLSMAVLQPFVVHRRTVVRALLVASMIAGSALSHVRAFVPMWGAWFALGVLAFLLRSGRLSRAAYAVGLLAAAGTIGVEATPVQGIVAGLTSLVIGTVHLDRPRFATLGALSYSLYLVHEPIGGRVVNLAVHWDRRPWFVNVAVVAAALAVSLGAAWLLHHGVERPAQRWASRIRYRAPRPAGATAARPPGR